MNKILVTGATGHLGKATVTQLVEKVDAKNVAVLVRDAAKAEDLKQLGVEIRVGDYSNYPSLVNAFKGIDKLFFVSANDVEARMQQHENIVKAAKEADVKHVVYTSFIRNNETETSPIALVASSHIKAEEWLKESGIAYTFLRNALYMDLLPWFTGDKVLETGTVYFPSADGKSSFTLRNDMAAVGAHVLATGGHENKIYNITNTEAVSFADIAAMLAEISGKPIKHVSPTFDEFVATMVAAGVPEGMAQFEASFAEGIKQGEFAQTSNDIELLTGKKPTTVKQFLQQVYAAQANN
jgi:NAD(P)H dehydrogenase (quinone)